jgi:hypothetical protein
MKNIKRILVTAGIILIASILWSCEGNCLKGNGNVQTMPRTETGFTGVEVQGDLTVYVTEGSSFDIQVVADENLHSHIETYISGNDLVVRALNGRCFKKYDRLDIYVTAPQYYVLKLKGSGILRSQGMITSDSLEVSLNGSGMMDVSNTGNKMFTDLKGSGKIYLNGACQQHNITLDGSGLVQAFDMTAQFAQASVNGSGAIEVYAQQTLNAYVNGSGLIRYKPNPIVTQNISGSGAIIKD